MSCKQHMISCESPTKIRRDNLKYVSLIVLTVKIVRSKKGDARRVGHSSIITLIRITILCLDIPLALACGAERARKIS
jgi:hypothetical protein